jgi:hypothetical protein
MSTKPGSTGAGGVTSPNTSNASRICSRASVSESGVGRNPNVVVERNRATVTNSTAASAATATVTVWGTRRRRSSAAMRWASSTEEIAGARNEPLSKTRRRESTLATDMAVSESSATTSSWDCVRRPALIEPPREAAGRGHAPTRR